MGALEIVRLVLLFVHLAGFAMLFGGFVTQYFAGKFRINGAMLWGSVIQLVTGIGLSAPLRGGSASGNEPDPIKLVVKFVIAALIFAMVFVVRKRESVAKGHFVAIGGMTLLNAAVAVFWT